jgi:ADP-heptose:LPS heptosyltransferase
VFASLKDHYPAARIDVLLGMHNSFMLENDPAIGKRWIYRKKNIRAIVGAIASIRRERYDFVIDMMDNSSVTGTILSLLCDARRNVGLVKDNGFAYDISVPRHSRADSHIVDRTARLLAAFGIDPEREQLRIRYSVPAEAEIFASRFFLENHLDPKAVVGVNISAGSSARFWGTDNFRWLIAAITEKYPNLKVIVLFRPDDADHARAIAASHGNVLPSPLTGTFDQFAALINKTSFLVSPDTSAIHLASAFDIPTVILVHKDQRIWVPYHTDFEAVVTEISIPAIPFDAVFSAFECLYERTSRQG